MQWIRTRVANVVYRATGERLGVTERTVQFHATNIYAKAGVHGRRGFAAHIDDFPGDCRRRAPVSTSLPASPWPEQGSSSRA